MGASLLVPQSKRQGVVMVIEKILIAWIEYYGIEDTLKVLGEYCGKLSVEFRDKNYMQESKKYAIIARELLRIESKL